MKVESRFQNLEKEHFMVREFFCIHQFYPYYHDNGQYGGHYCLHCGKWKTLSNQVDFSVKTLSGTRISLKCAFAGLAESLRGLAAAMANCNRRRI